MYVSKKLLSKDNRVHVPTRTATAPRTLVPCAKCALRYLRYAGYGWQMKKLSMNQIKSVSNMTTEERSTQIVLEAKERLKSKNWQQQYNSYFEALMNECAPDVFSVIKNEQ